MSDQIGPSVPNRFAVNEEDLRGSNAKEGALKVQSPIWLLNQAATHFGDQGKIQAEKGREKGSP